MNNSKISKLEVLQSKKNRVNALNSTPAADSKLTDISVLISENLRTEKELKILNKITQAMNESYKPEDIYKTALENIIDLEYVDHSCIYIVDEDNKEAVLVAHRDMTEDFVTRAGRVPYPKGVTWKVINSGEILNVSDASTDESVGAAGKALGFKSMLGIPIRIEGKVKGVFWFLSDKNHHYTKQIEEFLTSIGNQIATAIARANIYYSLEKKYKYEEILSQITRIVHRSVDFDEIIGLALEQLKNGVELVDHIGVYLVEENYAVLKAFKGFNEEYLKRASKIPYPVGGTWKTIIEQKPIFVSDTESSDIVGPAGKKLFKCYKSMPIFLDGKAVGALGICSNEKHAFKSDEQDLLKAVAGQIDIAFSKSRQSKILRESEERYRSLVENTSDLIAEVDFEGKLIFVNKSCCNFLGFGFYDLLEKKILDFIHPDDAAKFSLKFDYTKKSNVSQNCEFRLKKNGKWLFVESTITFAKNFKGENVILISARDISDRKKLEEKQLRMDKLESVGVLAGGIAHDFNNLITIILGSLSLLDIALVERDEKVSRYIRDLETAASRAENLTGQLLTFSKGGAPLKEVISSFSDLVKETAEFSLRGSNSKCEFDVEDGLWPLEVDTGQMSQVIQNLIINADQSMPSGGVINIDVKNIVLEHNNKKLINKGKYVNFNIIDKGIGMTKDVANKIFDPYFTTKSRGSGLGLTTVYSIIKNHDGHIFVDSEVGVGTTFSVYIPITEKVIVNKREHSGLIKVTGTVLIMDDDYILRRVITSMLEHLGYQVEQSENGEEAIEKYKKKFNNKTKFDLVILDLTIPGGIGGKETQEQLREIDPDTIS
ncbi:MAG: GAF domain-containing protein, partial [Thermodesulfobacteriota bacterium]